MMMKLMKFLVIALVAGGVFAPVPSQAGKIDGKAVRCEKTLARNAGVIVPEGGGNKVLNRKTLVWKSYMMELHEVAQCELIAPHKIESIYQPWVDHQKAVLEKQTEGNKL